jgi:hypothetical protein
MGIQFRPQTTEMDMLRIVSDGENRHRLEDATGTAIGWIRGRRIGFRGFATELMARGAVVATTQALQRALRQHYPGWVGYEPVVDKLRTVHDGTHEWFYDGTAQVARLLRPRHRAYDTSLGIEFTLPSYASEGVAMAVAQSLANAVKPYREEEEPTPAA